MPMAARKEKCKQGVYRRFKKYPTKIESRVFKREEV